MSISYFTRLSLVGIYRKPRTRRLHLDVDTFFLLNILCWAVCVRCMEKRRVHGISTSPAQSGTPLEE